MTLPVLVLEKGVRTLEDGTVIQVGELSTSKFCVKGFEEVAFAQDFASTPSIFSRARRFDAPISSFRAGAPPAARAFN